MVQPLFQWRMPQPVAIDPACIELARARGVSRRLMALLAARGVTSAGALASFLATADEELHDPALLPDAAIALRRVEEARSRSERILVYGDFDADGLCGLSILVLAFRALGLDAAPYVPERLGDGHGLSLRAIERAAAENRTLIVTADCGTSSEPEIAIARDRGIDVLVTDHHHAPVVPASAVAVINPQRADSEYPERRLTGAGVAWKVAHLLLRAADGSGAGASPPAAVRAMADLALIGTVADVAPVLGENRAIARLGLERLRIDPRPGLAALIARANIVREKLDLDDIGYALAPRLNAAGRVGEAARAARLLLAEDRQEAETLAQEIDGANRERREMTRTALAEVRRTLCLEPPTESDVEAALVLVEPEGAEPAAAPGSPPAVAGTPPVVAPLVPAAPPMDLPPALLIRGDWPVGIVGLIAGRLAEDFSRPVIVATSLEGEPGSLRASCRSGGALDLAQALVDCSELLIRHGGHEAAAGFDIRAENWAAFSDRFLALTQARAIPPAKPQLNVDLVLSADSVDFGLIRDVELLEPTGPGNPRPMIGITGLKVVRARPANGGHTQLVLRRTRDVLDAIAFRRADLAAALREGDQVDIVARASVRTFGGLETMQLEVLDVADAGTQLPLARAAAPVTADLR
jgi:single-stranded-DNA-specific exonuclease